ncbi:MAG: hypothetical protein DMG38_16190 [Acidobacteria bacterium]|nr:MAG: hypothetical protein DMG38_16190 [Acidobacteriota bacterium]
MHVPPSIKVSLDKRKPRVSNVRRIVGVGIVIAHDPLLRSGQAELPTLALGNDAHAAERIRMADSGQGQPAVDEAPHTIPEDAAVLAAPRQRAVPDPT